MYHENYLKLSYQNNIFFLVLLIPETGEDSWAGGRGGGQGLLHNGKIAGPKSHTHKAWKLVAPPPP